MNRVDYPEPIKELVLLLKRLPGIGPRSAERIALWMQREDIAFSQSFARVVLQARTEVQACLRCGFYATEAACVICRDTQRDPTLLCVVEQPSEVIAIEHTGAFQGRYHVLGGQLSPLRQVGPEDLRIDTLLSRLHAGDCKEVILALSNDVEGEATANYIVDLLRAQAIKITKLAQGLPAGSGLENADELTLFRALSGRQVWES